jgi:hypothetical protein
MFNLSFFYLTLGLAGIVESRGLPILQIWLMASTVYTHIYTHVLQDSPYNIMYKLYGYLIPNFLSSCSTPHLIWNPYHIDDYAEKEEADLYLSKYQTGYPSLTVSESFFLLHCPN